MAAVTDYANPAAAVTGGYSKTQIDRGAPTGAINLNPGQPARYMTVFEKPTVGAAQSGAALRATGESSASAAAADTAALAALNANRRSYYGGSPGRASGDGDSPNSRGQGHTIDVT